MAHICRARGYKCVIYMPNTQSKEKVDTLRSLGAEVREVPAVPFTDPQNYNHQARRYAESIPNAVWGNQFDNTANRQAHIDTTGPEIWNQTQGKVTGFVCSTGTGGTLSGVSAYLKSRNPNVKIWCADPPGSVLYNHFTQGKLERKGLSSITEGIGQGRITDNLAAAEVDGAVFVDDKESLEMVWRLLDEEGIAVGASSALNIVAAVKMAKTLPAGSNVVSILCDSAYRYRSRLFSLKWLKSKDLDVASKYHHYLIE
eukprot:TRINITY_DN14506_c0_g2_i2.p1 TRINITY_DN14506_c0_g2~~TRINITY_DN14506_c0_g2_i2.p1  ORF type:complete len:257 (+),score=42.86 TRINITY_DN14506_c0_g2_i2:102-872(+)